MGEARVTMSCLGRIGRFGNQLFQYAFLRDYARRHSLAVETSPWVGQGLFGHRDPAITQALPVVYELGCDLETTLITNLRQPITNADLWGYFQLHTSYYAAKRNWFRSLFKPIGDAADEVRRAIGLLRARGNTIVGVHLRRGDKTTGRHVVPSSSLYRNWLANRWPHLASPVLFVATDEPEATRRDFAEFGPILADQLGAASFYLDFFVLTQCDVLAISNSTFSFAASMLNERCSEFFRFTPETRDLLAFDPWNACPFLRDDFYAQDYYADLLQRARHTVSTSSLDQYRSIRREVANNWLGTAGDEGSLTIAYFGSLGRAHRACLQSRLRQATLTEQEYVYCQDLLTSLASGLPDDWFASYALAVMLYCRPEDLLFPVNLVAIPQFMRDDYLNFLRGK